MHCKIGAFKAINIIIYNNIRQNGIAYIKNKSIIFNIQNNINACNRYCLTSQIHSSLGDLVF